MKLFGGVDLDAAHAARDFGALADGLAKGEPAARERALSMIIDLRDPAAIGPVLAKYGSGLRPIIVQQDMVYAEYCERIVSTLDPESQVLRGSLGKKKSGIGAAWVLARRGPGQSEDELLAAYGSSNEEKRIDAGKGLGLLGGTRAVEALADGSPDRMVFAAEPLGWTRDIRAKQALERLRERLAGKFEEAKSDSSLAGGVATGAWQALVDVALKGVVEPRQPHWPKFYTPANWYPDPDGGAGMRYWDGDRWAEPPDEAAGDGASSQTAPGWYADPWQQARLRWWDGSAWTGNVEP
jgi:hypothetical protein